MKTVVVEKKNGKAIVIDTKGNFYKIKDSKDLVIGKEYEKGMVWKVNRKLIAMGAALAIVFTLGTTGYAYTIPVDYVTLDINPSVELGVNMFGKVVDVNSFNDDGTNITKGLGLKGDTVDVALKGLVKEAKNQGYLKADEKGSVMVTVATKNTGDIDKLQKLAEDAVSTELKDDNLVNTEVVVEKVTEERQKEAKIMGISPGKVLLIQKLKTFNNEVKLEDYANKPIKEIMKEINNERKSDISEKKQNKNQEKSNESGKENATEANKQNNTSDAVKTNSTDSSTTNQTSTSTGVKTVETKQEENKSVNENNKEEINGVKENNKEDKKENSNASNNNETNNSKNIEHGKGNNENKNK